MRERWLHVGWPLRVRRGKGRLDLHKSITTPLSLSPSCHLTAFIVYVRVVINAVRHEKRKEWL